MKMFEGFRLPGLPGRPSLPGIEGSTKIPGTNPVFQTPQISREEPLPESLMVKINNEKKDKNQNILLFGILGIGAFLLLTKGKK